MNERQDRLIENLLVADAMIRDLPNSAFVPKLCTFMNVAMREHGVHHCGSAACFGGWVALHPHFQKQGVKAFSDGAPYSITGRDVSAELFGVWGMFEGGTSDGRNEKQEILARIHDAMDQVLKGSYYGH